MAQPAPVAESQEGALAALRAVQDRLEREQERIIRLGDPRQWRRRDRLDELLTVVEAEIAEIQRVMRGLGDEVMPAVYALGGVDAGIAVGTPFTWTQSHLGAVQQLAGNTFEAVLSATSYMREDSKRWMREWGRVAAEDAVVGGQTAQQSARKLAGLAASQARARGLPEPIHAVIYKNGARMPIGAYSEMLVRTQTAQAYNLGTVNHATAVGVTRFEVFDSPDCGLAGHDDPTKPAGMIIDARTASSFSISHPNCVRGFGPRPDREPAPGEEARDVFSYDPSTTAEQRAANEAARIAREGQGSRARVPRQPRQPRTPRGAPAPPVDPGLRFVDDIARYVDNLEPGTLDVWEMSRDDAIGHLLRAADDDIRAPGEALESLIRNLDYDNAKLVEERLAREAFGTAATGGFAGPTRFGTDRVLDLRHINDDVVREYMGTELDRLAEAFPEVADRITRIGDYFDDRIKVKMRGMESGTAVRPSASRGGKIALGDISSDRIWQQWSTGHLSTNHPAHTAIHEFGHHVHYYADEIWRAAAGARDVNVFGSADDAARAALRAGGAERNSSSIMDRLVKEALAEDKWQGGAYDRIYNDVSHYAGTNGNEAFAESFVDVWVNGENAKPTSQSIVSYVLDFITEHGPTYAEDIRVVTVT